MDSILPIVPPTPSASLSLPSSSSLKEHLKVPLFDLVNLPARLIIDNVYLNGLHALRRFQIRNICTLPIVVKLRSSLGSQLAFQLTNENLPDTNESSDQLRSPTSSSGPDVATCPSSGHAKDNLWTSTTSVGSAPPNQVSSADGGYQTTKPPTARSSSFVGAVSVSSRPSSVEEPITCVQKVDNTDSTAIQPSASQPLYAQQFNQLFNYVNHVDEVLIEPGMTQKVIIAFLPESREKGRHGQAKHTKDELIGSTIEGDESFDFFEVNGMLFFFGYIQALESNGPGSALPFPTLDVSFSALNSILPSSARSRLTPRSDKSPLSPVIDNESSSKPSSPDLVSSTNPHNLNTPPDYQTTVKFRSRVCRSVLWVDVCEIVFDDAVVGAVYFRDFTVWNRSEIDLHWTANVLASSNGNHSAPSMSNSSAPPNHDQALDNAVWKLIDCDTGEPSDTKPIPSFSRRRIRLAFKPSTTGDVGVELQFENLNDTSNSIQVYVHAMVKAAVNEEVLMIASGSSLDFGECLAGTWHKQEMVLRNISETNLDVVFSSDYADVIFRLKVDDDINQQQESDTESQPLLTSISRALQIDDNDDDESESDASPPSSPPVVEAVQPSVGSSRRSSLDVLEILQTPIVSTQNDDISHNIEDLTSIEEIILKPGTARIIEVLYRPEKEVSTADSRGGRLSRKSFKIFLSYTALGSQLPEKKTIQCKAKSCTSLIDISPREVNFGDTDVGTLKSAPLVIANLSDLACKIELRFISKVLNTYRDEIVIPPKQSVEVKIDIYPRKVNPDYSKQITIVNLTNRDNDQTVQVRSNNIDKNRVTFHSLFYRILTPKNTNYFDFGGLVLNSPGVRTFTIDNVSTKRLVIDLSTSMPEEMLLYVRSEELLDESGKGRDSESIQRREKLLDMSNRKIDNTSEGSSTAGSNGNIGKGDTSTAASATRLKSQMPSERQEATERTLYLDLATVSERRSPRRRIASRPSTTTTPYRNVSRDRQHVGATNDASTTDTEDPPSGVGKTHTGHVQSAAESLTRMPTSKLINALEATTGISPPLFPKASDEEKYVRAEILLYSELGLSVSEKRLLPAKRVVIPAQSQLMLIMVLTPAGHHKPTVQSKPRKFDGRIYMKLVEFDKSIRQPQFDALLQGDEIPVREFLFRCYICRSVMELGQKHINFGTLVKNERRTKSIVIRNSCEAPLLYAIRKSGTVASGDVIIGEGRYGIIRSSAQKEVEFVFDPSLSGPFQERLMVENVLDHTNDQVLSLKAQIRKPSNFFIQSMDIDFGACLIDKESPKPQSLVVSNTSSKQSRMIEVRVEAADLSFQHFDFKVRFETVSDADLAVDNEDGARSKSSRVLLSKADEEKLEQLEQKLKIATRKNRPDKVRKLTDQIERLKSGLEENSFEENSAVSTMTASPVISAVGSSVVSGTPTPTVAQPSYSSFNYNTSLASDAGSLDSIVDSTLRNDATARPESRVNKMLPPRPRTRIVDNSIVFHLEPREVQTISVYTNPMATSANPPLHGSETINCNILVHEHRNTDSTKVVKMRAVVCFDHLAYLVESQRLIAASASNCNDNESVRAENDRDTDSAPELSVLRKKASSWRMLETDILPTPTSVINSPSSDTLEKSVVADSRDAFIDHANSIVRQSPSLLRLEPSSRSSDISTPSTSLSLVPPSAVTSTIKWAVETRIVDLGRFEEGIRRDCYFVLVNHSSGNIEYNVGTVSPQIAVPVCGGSVAPLTSKRVELSITSCTRGRQTWSLTVTVDNLTELVVYHGYVTANHYLRFPTVNDNTWDLGDCFVDPAKKYAKVLQLPVENVTAEDVYVTGSSNLAQQCLMFLDPSLENPVTETLVPQKSSTVFYVALQPYVSRRPAEKAVFSSAPTTPQQPSTNPAQHSDNSRQLEPGDRSKDNSRVRLSADESRNLVGGLRFIIQIKEDSLSSSVKEGVVGTDTSTSEAANNTSFYTLVTQTIKFTALIGQSTFAVSESLIDFGRTLQLNTQFERAIKISNTSHRLPLVCNIKTSSSLLRVSSSTIAIPRSDTSTSTEVIVSLEAVTFGLVEESITLANANNSCQVVNVKIRLFVDSLMMSVSREIIEWNDIYVCATDGTLPSSSPRDASLILLPNYNGTGRIISRMGLMKRKSSDMIPAYEESFELQNLSDELIEVMPRSNLQLHVRWVVARRAGFVISRKASTEITNHYESASENEDSDVLPVVGQVESMEQDRSSLYITTNSVTEVDEKEGGTHVKEYDIDDQVGAHLLLHPHQKAVGFVTVPQPTAIEPDENGRIMSLDGYLVLDEAEKKTSLQLIKIQANYCQSIGEVHPLIIDLKSVKSGSSSEFEFSIVNQAEIPLCYDMLVPEYVDIEGEFQRLVPDQDDNVVHTVIPAYPVPSRATQVINAMFNARRNGGRGMQDSMIQVHNMYNPKNIATVNVSAVVTGFELKFDRLTSGELILPPLNHPSTTLSPTSCGAWFSIVNPGEEEVKFEIGTKLMPSISQLVRLEVLSRSTSSPLDAGVITLSSKTSIDVRIRAFPLECRVTSLGVMEEAVWAELLICDERIGVKGRLIEGPSFILSDARLVFSAAQVDNEARSRLLSVTVTNVLASLPLRFQVTVELPMEIPSGTQLIKIHPLDDNMCGTIEANGRSILSLELMTLDIAVLSEDIKILFVDLDSLSRPPQLLLVSIAESENEVIPMSPKIDAHRSGPAT
ncbi:hypothetical protein SeLEV6574_g06148 [Synchytrium endobioticum]|nr:hypothetical protein SeLEV6574_g06148 [Synchytrium endobioticum]